MKNKRHCTCCEWWHQREHAADGLCEYCAGHGAEPCTERGGLRYLRDLVKQVRVVERRNKDDIDTDILLEHLQYAVKLFNRDAQIARRKVKRESL